MLYNVWLCFYIISYTHIHTQPIVSYIYINTKHLRRGVLLAVSLHNILTTTSPPSRVVRNHQTAYLKSISFGFHQNPLLYQLSRRLYIHTELKFHIIHFDTQKVEFSYGESMMPLSLGGRQMLQR